MLQTGSKEVSATSSIETVITVSSIESAKSGSSFVNVNTVSKSKVKSTVSTVSNTKMNSNVSTFSSTKMKSTLSTVRNTTMKITVSTPRRIEYYFADATSVLSCEASVTYVRRSPHPFPLFESIVLLRCRLRESYRSSCDVLFFPCISVVRVAFPFYEVLELATFISMRYYFFESKFSMIIVEIYGWLWLWFATKMVFCTGFEKAHMTCVMHSA